MNKNKFFKKVITGILGVLLVVAMATSAGADTINGSDFEVLQFVPGDSRSHA